MVNKNIMNNYTTEELNKLLNVIKNNELSIVKGGILQEFEKSVAKFFDSQFAVATCNGTSAIYLALFALGITEGDEVILPAYGFHAIGVAICQIRATPIFCDIDNETLTIDFKEVEKKISSKTKAVIVLQTWGNIANLDDMLNIKKRHPNIKLISDSSHAHGAKWKGNYLGKYFDAVAVSFGKDKMISGGELGVLLTNNVNYRDRALLYSHVNRVPQDLIGNEYKGIKNAVGLKMRPHAIALNIALIKLKKFNNYFKKIQTNIQIFEKELGKLLMFKFAKSYTFAERSYWKIPLIINKDLITDNEYENIVLFLNNNDLKVESDNYRVLLHKNTIFTEYYRIENKGKFVYAESLKNKIIQIPEYLFYYRKNIDKMFTILSNCEKMFYTKRGQYD